MRTTARTSRRGVLAALGIATTLTLTACAGMGWNRPPQPNVDDVSTSFTKDEVELTMAYVDDPPTQALIDGFTDKHPNVTIDPQQTSFNDYVKSIKLSMSSDAPPDIAQYNPGAMNSLVTAGYILNLRPWAEAYGWPKKFPPSSLEVLSSDKQAKRFGTGNLYAAPGSLSVLGVFYNRSILAKAGVSEPPTTLAGFEKALQKAKASGIDPLSAGALQVGGFQLWNAILNGTGDVAAYRDWVYGKPSATIDNPEALRATKKLTEWASKGYLPESANATADSDAQASFVQGKSAFLVTGNWAAAEIEKEMGEDVGFFLMPSASGGPVTVASGSSVAYSISTRTEHPNVAAAFLDYLSSPEAAKLQFQEGFMPVDTKTELGATGLRKEIATEFARVADAGGTVPFPDYATPGMIDKLTPGIQGLLTSTMTEKEFLQSLQDSWDEHHGS